MLSREVMGMFCLGVVCLTALLVAGAALQDLRDLRAIVKRARKAIQGIVEGGDLAEWAVEQTGRATDDDAIAFHDRTFHSEILGGKVKTESGVIDSWNSGAERMFGYRVEEIVGQTADVLLAPEDRDAGVAAEELDRARRQGRAASERNHIRKNGSRFYVSGVTTRLGAGGLGFAKIARP